MAALQELCGALARIAPLDLAESWDNVGLLVGDRSADIRRAMTCLTVTPDVVDEAEAEKVDLVIVHHPLPFKPLQRITTDSIAGSMLLRLIRSGAAVYSAHTAFDSAADGINQMWAQTFDLVDVAPLDEIDQAAAGEAATPNVIGAGRCGRLSATMTLQDVVQRAADSTTDNVAHATSRDGAECRSSQLVEPD